MTIRTLSPKNSFKKSVLELHDIIENFAIIYCFVQFILYTKSDQNVGRLHLIENKSQSDSVERKLSYFQCLFKSILYIRIPKYAHLTSVPRQHNIHSVSSTCQHKYK